MSELRAFLGLGFHHIVSPGALDHLLFLLVLVAPYRLAEWRRLLGVASAFTLGHSLTLALVVTDLVRIPAPLVEFLIPLTIVAGALDNLRRRGTPSGWLPPGLAAAFGLIHGAGFAGFLREMLGDPVAGPLFAFNVGIELGQLSVLAALLLLLAGVEQAAPRATLAGRAPRSLLASGGAGVAALFMALSRLPG